MANTIDERVDSWNEYKNEAEASWPYRYDSYEESLEYFEHHEKPYFHWQDPQFASTGKARVWIDNTEALMLNPYEHKNEHDLEVYNRAKSIFNSITNRDDFEIFYEEQSKGSFERLRKGKWVYSKAHEILDTVIFEEIGRYYSSVGDLISLGKSFSTSVARGNLVKVITEDDFTIKVPCEEIRQITEYSPSYLKNSSSCPWKFVEGTWRIKGSDNLNAKVSKGPNTFHTDLFAIVKAMCLRELRAPVEESAVEESDDDDRHKQFKYDEAKALLAVVLLTDETKSIVMEWFNTHLNPSTTSFSYAGKHLSSLCKDEKSLSYVLPTTGESCDIEFYQIARYYLEHTIHWIPGSEVSKYNAKKSLEDDPKVKELLEQVQLGNMKPSYATHKVSGLKRKVLKELLDLTCGKVPNVKIDRRKEKNEDARRERWMELQSKPRKEWTKSDKDWWHNHRKQFKS